MFKLSNHIKKSAKFKAYFLEETQYLTVEPASGQLEPLGKAGTPFYVKFSSNIENKSCSSKLVIETAENYWSFRVKAQLAKKLKNK